MKKQCAKCKDDTQNGADIVEAGTLYSFCKSCAYILNDLPTGNTIPQFLGAEKQESWISKNMRVARERRAKGERIWT